MNTHTQNSSRQDFIYWQCQIRKFSARKLQGRPTAGVRPELILDEKVLGQITTLLVPILPADDISHLKHVYKRTHDPNKRRKDALKYLRSEFYQVPAAFNGELTALAAHGVLWVDQTLNADRVELYFDQDSKQFRLDCRATLLTENDPRWQFTLAHNQLFNPTLTDQIRVLLFEPDWELGSN